MKWFKILVALICSFSGVHALAGNVRQVIDAEGTRVLVPEAPRRIAVLSEIDFDICLALGIKPLAAINGRGQNSFPHYLREAQSAIELSDIPIVGDLGRPNLEKLVTLKPDLILTAPSRPETLAMLRKIAPTVVSFKNGDPWQDVFQRAARVLNQEPAAAQFMSSYRNELQGAKAKLAAWQGKTVSIVRWNPTGPAFMFQDAFASLVLRDMGFERPTEQKIAGQKHSMPISMEALHMIDGDWLFIGTLDPRKDQSDAMREISGSSSFQRLAAIKSRHYGAVDGSKWTSIGGPLAALSIVKEATAMISQKN